MRQQRHRRVSRKLLTSRHQLTRLALARRAGVAAPYGGETGAYPRRHPDDQYDPCAGGGHASPHLWRHRTESGRWREQYICSRCGEPFGPPSFDVAS
jgi:hypothetical protein